MWIKLIVAFFVLAFCVFLGYLAAGKYRARKKFYSAFSVFNERYLSELKYGRRSVKTVAAETAEGDFRSALLQTLEGGKAVGLGYLREDEIAFSAEYFQMLGRGDSRSQTEFFQNKRGGIEEKRAEAEREAKARGELYLKLGLLFGLAFVILIV